MKLDDHVFIYFGDGRDEEQYGINEYNSHCIWCKAYANGRKEDMDGFSYIYPYNIKWSRECFSENKKNRIIEENLIRFETHKVKLRYDSKFRKRYECENCNVNIECYMFEDKLLYSFSLPCHEQIIKNILE